MNVYDAAHNLAKAIKESDELSKFKELQTQLYANEIMKAKFDNFQKMQMELQTAQMTGQQLDETKLAEAQAMFEEIQKDPTANAYFQAELKLNQMMGDVSKIIGDAMGLVQE